MYSMMMESPLPHSEFEWVSAEEIARVRWEDLSESDSHMYFACVDIEYGRELHRRDAEWPCLVDRVCVEPDWLSAHQAARQRACGISDAQLKTPRLIANFMPKKEYLIHGLALAAYLKRGLRITKYHYGVRFRQEAFLKPFIRLLMRLRQEATHKFEQQVFKVGPFPLPAAPCLPSRRWVAYPPGGSLPTPQAPGCLPSRRSIAYPPGARLPTLQAFFI